jgi:hypothetical protein
MEIRDAAPECRLDKLMCICVYFSKHFLLALSENRLLDAIL